MAAGNATVGALNAELAINTASWELGLKGAGDSLTKFAANSNAAAANIQKHSKAIQQAGLNMSRQFTDIGVQLAGGQSPFLVLTQQLPQIADGFAQAKMQGVGVGQVFKGLGASIAPMVPALAGVGVAVGAAVGGFALFERAVDKQTKYATTWGDTWNATLKVLGDRLMNGPVGDGLKWLGGAFNKALDAITGAVTWFADKVVGHFGAMFQLVVQNWRQLPAVFGFLIQETANNVIRGVEFLVNGTIKGLNVLLKAAGMGLLQTVDLPEIRLANAKIAADYDRMSKSISASFRKGREGLLGDIARQADKEYLARQKAKKGTEQHSKAVNDNAKEVDAWAKAVAEAEADGLKFAAALRTEAAEMGLGTRELKLRNIALQEMIALANGLPAAAAEIRAAGQAWVSAFDAEQAKAGLKDMEEALDAWAGRLRDAKDKTQTYAEDMADAFAKVSYSVSDMWSSLKSGDIGRVLQNFQALGGGIQGVLQGGAGGIPSLGSIAANAIGGRTGRAVGSGLGIAATGIGLGTALGTGGALAGLGATLGPAIVGALGPIGIAAGALYAAAKLLNVGGKPSNKGAGFDLTTGALSGNKRSQETEEAVRSAGEAITGIQDALKEAGLGLTDTVRGLVIGTRDATQIYLASGKMLTSAVGDSGAAVDTALRALLDGATYVSEGQRKLVEAALATGKGFDAVSEALAKYKAAQDISKTLADRILQIVDPQKFDTEQVKRGIADERAAAAKLAAEGALTADQLAEVNAQLDRLQGLELDEVLKRYGQGVESAAAKLEAVEGRYEDAVSALEATYEDEADALRRATDEQVAALEKSRDAFLAAASSLSDFTRDVRGEIAGAGDPTRALAQARAALAAVAGRGDQASLAQIPTLGRALLDASKTGARSAIEQARDRADVLRIATQGEALARAQAASLDGQMAGLRSVAEQQLEQLKLQVGQYVQLNTNIVSLADRIAAVDQARRDIAATAASAQAAPGINAGAVAAQVAALSGSGLADQLASSGLTPEQQLAELIRVAKQQLGIWEDVTQGSDAIKTAA